MCINTGCYWSISQVNTQHNSSNQLPMNQRQPVILLFRPTSSSANANRPCNVCCIIFSIGYVKKNFVENFVFDKCPAFTKCRKSFWRHSLGDFMVMYVLCLKLLRELVVAFVLLIMQLLLALKAKAILIDTCWTQHDGRCKSLMDSTLAFSPVYVLLEVNDMPTTFSTAIFHTQKICTRLFRQNICKYHKFEFWATLWDNIHASLWAWQIPIVDFLLVITELFLLTLMEICQSHHFWSSRLLWLDILGGRGCPPINSCCYHKNRRMAFHTISAYWQWIDSLSTCMTACL